MAKVPQESDNQGLFSKRAFVLDREHETVTCPGGQTTGRFTEDKAGGKTFQFSRLCEGCPLRAHCTRAAGSRTRQVHPQEALLQAARAAQETPAGRARLRERVVAEHRLAQLGQLGVGQARYRGRRKSGFQLLVLAAIANLRWTWNWERGQAAQRPGVRERLAPVLRRFFPRSRPRSERAAGAVHRLLLTLSPTGFRPRFKGVGGCCAHDISLLEPGSIYGFIQRTAARAIIAGSACKK